MQINVKKIFKAIPEPLKSMAGTIGRYRIIESASFKKQYKILDEMAGHLEKDKIRDIQTALLRDTLLHAYAHVPYYHNLFDKIGFDAENFKHMEELQVIPFLTKDIIREHWSDLQANEIEKYYDSTSGGTTGKPIKFSFDNESLYKERAFVYHYWSSFGYDYKRSKLISFREADFAGKICRRNTLYNELLINPFLLDTRHIQDMLDEIYKFAGTFIYGYPSNIATFCRLLKKNNLKYALPVKAVFLISENLYPDQKRLIEEVLKCPIAMFYGHTEKAVFAERYGEIYQFNPFYGYTEILDEEEDNIVCTGFLNRKMPLIRYKVDDRAIPVMEGYKIVGHRSNEILYGRHDYTISATTLEFTHEECFEKVDAYQFEQNEIGKVIMKIESDQKISRSELAAIKKKAEEKLPEFYVDIIQTDKITRTARGKYKLIVQNIRRSGQHDKGM